MPGATIIFSWDTEVSTVTREAVTQLAHERKVWWVAGGILIGMVLGGIWPDARVHAVATDRFENFAICTAAVDTDVEAVYILDSLTGDLKCMVLSSQSGRFMNFYQRNIIQDLGPAAAKSPQFLLVSGMIDFRRTGGSVRTASSAIYIAEVNSGTMVAYTIPWAGDRQTQSTRPQGPFDFIRLDAAVFGNGTIRN